MYYLHRIGDSECVRLNHTLPADILDIFLPEKWLKPGLVRGSVFFDG